MVSVAEPVYGTEVINVLVPGDEEDLDEYEVAAALQAAQDSIADSSAKSCQACTTLNGFMLFSKEMRPKVKAEDPDLTFGGIGKRLGELWRGLSDGEKAKYAKK